MKRLLVLGGADIQVSAIKKAVSLDHYVITCDYRPDNPRHRFAHEYHVVRTTNPETVLTLVSYLEIDGVLAYSSLTMTEHTRDWTTCPADVP